SGDADVVCSEKMNSPTGGKSLKFPARCARHFECAGCVNASCFISISLHRPFGSNFSPTWSRPCRGRNSTPLLSTGGLDLFFLVDSPNSDLSFRAESLVHSTGV